MTHSRIASIPTLRRFLPVVSFLSGVTVLTLVLSMTTNKILAVETGTEGIALMGIFRNLGALLSGTLTLGYTTLFMQQLSLARTSEAKSKVIGAGFVLLFVQALFLAVMSIIGVSPISHWLFGHAPSVEEARNIRVVLAMAWINIGLQIIVSFHRGLGTIKPLSKLQLIAAASSLILIFPLLKLGTLGLALNVASGSAVALLFMGTELFREIGGKNFFRSLKEGMGQLISSAPPSLILTWQTLATTGAILSVQALTQKYWGQDALGNFNAAYLLTETAILVLMASVRSYFLPLFGELENDQDKGVLLDRMISLLLLLATTGIIVTCLLSPWIVQLLFSRKFTSAGTLLMIMSLSWLPACLSWSYNTFLLHRGAHFAFTVIDTAWSLIFLVVVWLGFNWGLGSSTAAISYTAVGFLSAFLYVTFTKKRYGNFSFGARAQRITIECLLVSAVALMGVFWEGNLALRSLPAVLAAIALAFVAKREWTATQ
jgi:O-antigen/teichoic acid export membrane protein